MSALNFAPSLSCTQGPIHTNNCLMLQVARLFRQHLTLLRHCCRFWLCRSNVRLCRKDRATRITCDIVAMLCWCCGRAIRIPWWATRSSPLVIHHADGMTAEWQVYMSWASWAEQGLTSHQTHYRSYRGRVFTGQMTQPTVSQHLCAYRCVQLSYTTQHGAVLIIFPLNLQTSITAQILSTGGEGIVMVQKQCFEVKVGMTKAQYLVHCYLWLSWKPYPENSELGAVVCWWFGCDSWNGRWFDQKTKWMEG